MMRLLSALIIITFTNSVYAADTLPLGSVIIEHKDKPISFTVEVAHNDQQRRQGLMNRESIGQFNGMLFLFPRADVYEFWMANTYIPLDMIFVNADEIVHIAHSVEPMSRRPQGANQLVTSVIELPGGTARDENIRVGDKVSYIFSRDLEIR
ncbi:MAG: DUF192 domain-containing protein [Alphaproteobacteria bacterium]|nr:DUF192 domain-containing protein [Alphaproteobacteria bacterium]